MTWINGKLLAFDLETTGPDPLTARIVTGTAILIDPTTGDKQVTEWLADPGVDIPAAATAIHGITTDHARAHGQAAETVVAAIEHTILSAWAQMIPVIGHNVGYDLTVLHCELVRHWGAAGGLDDVDLGPVLDTYVIDKHFSRRKGSRRLLDTAQFYEIDLTEQDAHGATADALASARILWRLTRVYPQLAELRLPELFAKQREWAGEQARSLSEYLAGQGKPADVCEAWPIRVPAVTE